MVEDITLYGVGWKERRIGEDGDAANVILEPTQTLGPND
jgi:hypothetical protein